MVVDYSLIGKRLAKIRKDRKMTQETLSEITDLTNNYISNIENNRSIPSLETLIKLCDALEITPNDILLGSTIASSHYIEDDLTEKLRQCTPKEKRILCGMIDLILAERNSEK